jgi:hypothetical protein
MSRRSLQAALLIALSGWLSAACGGSGHTTKRPAPARAKSSAAAVCQPGARDAMARMLAISATTISTSVSTGNNASPQCSFSTRSSAKVRVVVVANVYAGPQPYFILERTAVEASQLFTAKRLSPAPQLVTGLGLEADWFPAYPQRLMATDGTRLITVTVTWHGVSHARVRKLSIAVTRPYLKKPSARQAQALANGYPSGG